MVDWLSADRARRSSLLQGARSTITSWRGSSTGQERVRHLRCTGKQKQASRLEIAVQCWALVHDSEQLCQMLARVVAGSDEEGNKRDAFAPLLGFSSLVDGVAAECAKTSAWRLCECQRVRNACMPSGRLGWRQTAPWCATR